LSIHGWDTIFDKKKVLQEVENKYAKDFDFLPMSDRHWGRCKPTEQIYAMTSLAVILEAGYI